MKKKVVFTVDVISEIKNVASVMNLDAEEFFEAFSKLDSQERTTIFQTLAPKLLEKGDIQPLEASLLTPCLSGDKQKNPSLMAKQLATFTCIVEGDTYDERRLNAIKQFDRANFGDYRMDDDFTRDYEEYDVDDKVEDKSILMVEAPHSVTESVLAPVIKERLEKQKEKEELKDSLNHVLNNIRIPDMETPDSEEYGSYPKKFSEQQMISNKTEREEKDLKFVAEYRIHDIASLMDVSLDKAEKILREIDDESLQEFFEAHLNKDLGNAEIVGYRTNPTYEITENNTIDVFAEVEAEANVKCDEATNGKFNAMPDIGKLKILRAVVDFESDREHEAFISAMKKLPEKLDAEYNVMCASDSISSEDAFLASKIIDVSYLLAENPPDTITTEQVNNLLKTKKLLPKIVKAAIQNEEYDIFNLRDAYQFMQKYINSSAYVRENERCER